MFCYFATTRDKLHSMVCSHSNRISKVKWNNEEEEGEEEEEEEEEDNEEEEEEEEEEE